MLLFILLATALPVIGSSLYKRFLTKDTASAVTVCFHEKDEYVSLEFDYYLLGILLDKIDKNYSEETIKASAVALKSAVYYLKGVCRETCLADADYCDCRYSLAYTDPEEYLKKHGDNGKKRVDLIKNAINDTKDQFLLYENSYALGLVHTSSSVTTQSAFEVIGREYPYLECVITPEKADVTETFVLEADLIKRLEGEIREASDTDISPSLTLGRTGRVESVSLYSNEIAGERFAEIFALRSMTFEIEEAYGGIVVRTYGVGHGLGMSLMGAEKMISDGFKYSDVLLYYFRGCKIVALEEM